MNTKLTLTIEHSVIEKAKKHALDNGRSLSDIVENYLKVITSGNDDSEVELTPVVKSLKGAFKTGEIVDYKDELTKELTKKYL